MASSTWSRRLSARVGALPQPWIWIFTLAFTALVVSGDATTGADVAFTSLYYLPIAFGGWFGGRRLADAVAIVATLTALLVDLTSHAQRSAYLHVWNFACHAGVFITFAAVVPRLRELLRSERTRSLLDPLTGVLTRAGFFDLADREVLRARRTGRPLAVMYVDLDDLKQLNDEHGHATGDQALQVVGSVLRGELRSIDVAGRLGGDEFAAMLPDTTLGAAAVVATRIRNQVVADAGLRGLATSVSIGVACFIGPIESTEALVAAADRKMYLEKQRARAGAAVRLLPRAGEKA